MKRAILLLVALLVAVPAFGQKKYKIAPDSPEEKALLEIHGEGDANKRLALLDEFTKKFASSEALPATYAIYLAAYLQLQQYDKAIEFGEKAADADSEDLTAHMNLVRAAEAKNDYARVHKWTAPALALVQKATATRPPELDDEDWKKRQEALKSYGDYLEYALFMAASRDATPQRLQYVEAFAKLFPQSERQKKLPGLYAVAYQLLNDVPKMMEYAQKAIAAQPDDETMLLLLAETDVGQAQANVRVRKKMSDEALELAQRLLKVLETKPKPEGVADADWTKFLNNFRGAAYSIIGRSMMLQDRTTPALKELETAAKLLEENPQALGPVLYFLGFGYAKLVKYDAARPALSRCVQLGGPYAPPCQDILRKMSAVKGQ